MTTTLISRKRPSPFEVSTIWLLDASYFFKFISIIQMIQCTFIFQCIYAQVSCPKECLIFCCCNLVAWSAFASPFSICSYPFLYLYIPLLNACLLRFPHCYSHFVLASSIQLYVFNHGNIMCAHIYKMRTVLYPNLKANLGSLWMRCKVYGPLCCLVEPHEFLKPCDRCAAFLVCEVSQVSASLRGSLTVTL